MNTPLLQPTKPSEDWPELISLDTPNLSQINPQLIPSWAGAFAIAIAEHTETPPELVISMILAACATAAAQRLQVQIKPGYVEPCNLWIVAALPPGNRKSAVQKAATAPLLSWERQRAEELAPKIQKLISERKTLEARAKELRNKAAKERDNEKSAALAHEASAIESRLPAILVVPQLWTSDVTPERLGALLAEQGETMAWLSSEGGIFDLLQGRYSGGIPNLDLVLKAHSGDADRVDRGSRPPVFLERPRLTVGLSPQPEVLRGLTSKPGFKGRGLIGRFLYLLPPHKLGFRTLETMPPSKNILDAYHHGIHAMLNWPEARNDDGEPSLHTLTLDHAAYQEWHAFALHIESQMRPGETLAHCTDWAGKAPGAAARLAGVLHGIKHAKGQPWRTPINVETMNSALEILAVITEHSIAAMDLMGVDADIANARHVWAYIQNRRLNRFTVRELFNALRGTYKKAAQVEEILKTLEERGYVMIIQPSREGPGRPPSPIVKVRPDLMEGWE